MMSLACLCVLWKMEGEEHETFYVNTDGQVKKNEMLLDKVEVFLPSSLVKCPGCLEWCYELRQIFVLLNYFLFVLCSGSCGTEVLGMRDHIAPACLALQEGLDWVVMGNVYYFVLLIHYCFYFIRNWKQIRWIAM